VIVLRPYQHDALDRLREQFRLGRRRVCLYSPTGCHARGERVMRADGSSVEAQDVAIGELLMGENGPRRVLELHRGRQTMVRVTPIKGASFVVNLDHVLSLINTSTGEVTDISVREWLGKNQTFKHLHKLYRVGVESFAGEEQTLPVHPWLLGVMLGDGTLGGNFSVSNSNPAIQARVVELAEAHGVSAEVRHPAGYSDFIAMTNRRGVVNPLRKSVDALGLMGKRAQSKFVPSAYRTASRLDRAQLLAGLLDTDGHLHHGHYDWISASERLADDVCFIARSLGLAAYKAVARKFCQTGAGGDYWRVSISGDFSGIPTVKREPAARRQIKSVLRTGFSVEVLGEDDYFGWTVDGNGRYLMADFTVTHNSGKSEMGFEMIRGATARRRKALFLCNRIELVSQASRRLHAAGIRHGIIQGSNTRSVYEDVIVGSIQTLARRGCPDGVGLVVIDEAHGVAGSKAYVEFLKALKGVAVVGLSATPFSKGLGRNVPELGGALFESIVPAATIRELIDMQFLVGVDIYAPGEPDLSEVRTVAGEYHEGDLGVAADKPALIGDIVTHWKRLAAGKQTVVFAVNIAHSQHIVEQFVAAGITAEHIDCYTEDDDRRAILERVRSGETRVVSNVGVLAEGWDCPSVEVMICARPTKSLIRWIQMAGRILRPHEGKSRALILDHSGTAKRLGFPTDDLPLELDDGRANQAGKQVRKLKLPEPCPSCTYLKPRHIHACPMCGFAPKKRSEVESADGELELLKPKKHSTAEKQSFYSQLLAIADERGRAPGWVAHQYRAYFGVWPKGLSDIRMEPTQVVRNWVKHRQIAYAKRMQKEQRHAA